MKPMDIICYAEISDHIDAAKVDSLMGSMLVNGYTGAPVLIWGGQLLTGSHRLAAFKRLDKMGYDQTLDDATQTAINRVLDDDTAVEDVSDICEAACKRYEDENGEMPEIEYDRIGWLLAGSWAEAYKDEIAEW